MTFVLYNLGCRQ